ncbi:hypothetical protein HPG69_013961 [Diceros bicornis minor]|uniref:Uncharacterized protein n=1 Tax=Diceros bicornis minor TaxID=77932 RepID=A0A7J7EMW5_DICBM|nr:hypothetical protein HPG69_013961 [Diceros bicornis minor]
MMHLVHASYFHPGIPGSEDGYHFLGFHRMATTDLVIGMIFSLQTMVGILGNISVISSHPFIDRMQPHVPMQEHLAQKKIISGNGQNGLWGFGNRNDHFITDYRR